MRAAKYFILIITTMVAYSCGSRSEKTQKVLPVIGNYDLEYRKEGGKEIVDTIYPKVPSFQYLNQDSVMVKSSDLKGKVWIADFFFTKCPTICPPMTSQMKRLSILTRDLSDQVQFLSFSIDPDRDTPSRFREYMKEMGIEAKNWSFFTGDEMATYELAHDFFHVGAQRSEDAEGGFEHNDTFVLIDKEGYVRGLYEGTKTEEVDRLEKDLRKLLKYEYQYDTRTGKN